MTKVNPGQTLPGLPAVSWNRHEDAAAIVLDRGMPFGGGEFSVDPRSLVHIKNNSGSDVDRFGVLGVDGVIFTNTDDEDEFKNNFALKGVTPLAATHSGSFVILLETIASGDIGLAMTNGVTPVKLDITNAADTFADVKDSSAVELKTGSGSACILWKEAGTGSGKWGLVRFPDHAASVAMWRFSLTEDMGNTTADEASADIKDMSGATVSAGETIDDRLTNFRELKSGDDGLCIQVGSEYFPVLAERRHRYQYYQDITGHQSISIGGETKITAQSNSEFQPARYDGLSVGDLRQNPSERFFGGLNGNEFKHAGHYRCAYNIRFEDDSPLATAHHHQFEAYFKLGGNQVTGSHTEFYHDVPVNGDFAHQLSAFCVVDAAANDTLELFVNRSSAQTLKVDRWSIEVADIRRT